MVSLSTKAKATLDGLLSRAITEGKIPGAALVVGTADQELYAGTAGLKSFNDPSAGKLDENSVFWICSHTKLVVTIAILQLVERGILTYDTPVADIIPELANPVVVDDIYAPVPIYKPAQTAIKLRHLLNHSSGLYYSVIKKAPGDLSPAYTAAAYKADHSATQFFRIIRGDFPSVPLAFEPGTNWAYGWSCDVITFMVERLTGKTMEEYCKENIFGPLAMKTSFYLTPERRQNLVQLTYRRKDKTLEKWADQTGIIEQDPEKITAVLGGIGLYSTLSDYLTLLRHLLSIQAGKTDNPLLSVKTVSDLFRPTLPEHATASVYQFTGWKDSQFGIALCLANSDWPNGRRKKGSGFWFGWAGTYYFIDPATGIAVVYGSQVVPPQDSEVVKLWGALETALYEGLKA